MSEQPQLHASIVSLVSLAAGIAAKHPDMGLCQLERLREMGVPEQHITAVVALARHIRDEAAQKLDSAFDEKASASKGKPVPIPVSACCCAPTSGGQSCC